MERRDWSIKLLKELIYIDSLDSYEKANNLVSWYTEYFSKSSINDLDLELSDLKILEELFYRNINFLKEQQKQVGVTTVNGNYCTAGIKK